MTLLPDRFKMSLPVIEGLDVEPGRKSRGFVEAGPYFDNSPGTAVKIRHYSRIPFTAIRGSEAGPTLLVLAGAHPTEYAAIDVAIRLANEIQPEKLRGKLIVVPVVNTLGFWARSYLCPIDGVNVAESMRVGGIAPDVGGTAGHVIGYTIYNQFISKADYFIDLHGTDTSESCIVPGFAMYPTFGDAKSDAESEQLAKALGIELVDFIRPGAKRGKLPPRPWVGCEVGQGDMLLPELSSRLYQGVLNVMRYLKMIDGEVRKKQYKILRPRPELSPHHHGLFYLRVKMGDMVDEGQIVGEVKNLEGQVLETIRSPYKGILYFMIHNPVVEPGEKLLKIGVLE